MENNVTHDILHVCKTLNQNKVQYLIVGGTAVAFHGYFRWSQNDSGTPAEKFDLDIWYNPTYENYYRLLKALSDLDQDVEEFIREKTPDPMKSYFKFELNKITIDFLPKLKSPVSFHESYGKKETATMNETEIPFIGFEELLADKAVNSRPKDISDIRHLKSNKKP